MTRRRKIAAIVASIPLLVVLAGNASCRIGWVRSDYGKGKTGLAEKSVGAGAPNGQNYTVHLESVEQRLDDLTLRARVNGQALGEQVARAFDFDFSCLTRLGGCRAPCEIMPAAWNDYLTMRRNEGRALSSEDLKRYCPTGH